MSVVLHMPPAPVKKESNGPQPGAKHFDIILGFDFHFLKVPWPMTPCPVTPFAAIVFDPMDYIHITLPAMPVYSSEKGFEIATNIPMGGTVTINGCYRAAATSGLMALPPMIPIGPMLKKVGLKIKPPNPLHFAIPKAIILINFLAPHDGQISHGSETVYTSQMEQSALMCNVWSCNELGEVLMNNPMGLFANYATKIIAALPFGDPVMIGGPFIEHKFKIDDLVNALMMIGIMKGAAALLGRLLKALLKKLNAFLDAHPNIRSAVQPLICKFIGEPVDVASGTMTSCLQGFTLNGPIPLTWEVNYYSDSFYDGPIGQNMYHSYDISLFIDDKLEIVIMKDTAGRAIPFPVIERGQSFFNPMEKHELFRSIEGDYYIKNNEGLFYYFSKEKYKDGWQQLRTIANRNGFAIRFFYNNQGNLEKIIDSAHRSILFRNDGSGRITTIEMPHPDIKETLFDVIKYTYDENGRLISTTDALHQKNSFKWESRLITARQFKDNTIFTFSYDKKGKCLEALGPNGLYSYRFQYDDGMTIVENSLHHKSRYYHYKGVVSSIVDSRNGEKIFTYDLFNNLTGEQDAIGNVKSFSYDLRGNLLTKALPGLGSINYEYNSLDCLTKITQSNGGVWLYEYNAEGNLVKRINPLGAVSSYQYHNGQLCTLLNPTCNKNQLFYDKEYNLERVVLQSKAIIQYEYDFLGRCVKITDPNGNNLKKKYDLVNNLIQVNEPTGNLHRMQYDVMGNITNAKSNYNEISFTYNFFGDLTDRRQANRAVHFTYNTEGQLTRVINEANEVYSYDLDTEGNVIKETGFDGISHQYVRNLAGQISEIIKPNGKRTLFGYDASGNINLVSQPEGSITSYEYDGLNNLIKAQNGDSGIFFKRDLMGKIINEQQGVYSVDSEYNISGNRTCIKSNQGADIRIHYHPEFGWQEKMTASGWETNLVKNKSGNIVSRSFLGDIEQSYKYDTSGRLINQTIKQNNKINHQRAYTWHAADHLEEIADSDQGIKIFRHDEYGNLAEVIYSDGTKEYRLNDLVDNIFETTSHTDKIFSKGGKLLKSRIARYQYDGEGNIIEKSERNGKVWAYEWNEEGLLSKVVRPDGHEVTFGYDPLGRRLWKRFKNTTTKWLWDGNLPLHEWKEHETNNQKSGSASTCDNGMITWLFEENSFVPVGKIKAGKKYGIVTDHLGTPFAMYDEAGLKTWELELNGSGGTRKLKGEIGSCLFRFQGQYEDIETGLYYNRFRYYSPEESLYISQDLIGLEGGLRLYGYVKDTTFWVDIFGLTGIIYVRTDPITNKQYIGKSKSPETFKRRQEAHNRKLRKKTGDPNAEYKFDELETNVKGSGTVSDADALAKLEEDWIRTGNGPGGKPTQAGDLENQRHEMNDDRYKKVGGCMP